jgi:hypothetical protein
MTSREGRVGPLEGKHGDLFEGGSRFAHLLDPTTKGTRQLFSGHLGSGGTPDPSNVIDNVEESVRVERQDLRGTPDSYQGLGHMSRGNCADAAQILGEDQVGLQLLDELSIESIDRV